MRRRAWGAAAVLFAMLVTVAPAAAQTDPAAPTVPGPSQPPAAWIVVDADTGAVLNGANQHALLSPASTIKLLTALIALERLPDNDPIPISALAESKPARKINVKAGQVWDLEDLVYCMLLVSANDAAYAVAERVGGGSLDAWVTIAEATAARLGTVDHPSIKDPSGLDDSTFSNLGGDRISAYDMAIIARAVLAEPEVTAVMQTPHYEFMGGDAIHHTLNNHNSFLKMYEGATGMKTGGTDIAGRTLVASATRDGRTMVAVVFAAPNIYQSAAELLDQGFATPVAAQTGLVHLPAVVADAALDPKPVAEAPAIVPAAEPVVDGDGGFDVNSPLVAVGVLAFGGAPLLVILRRRAVVRRRAAKRAARLTVSTGPVRNQVRNTRQVADRTKV